MTGLSMGNGVRESQVGKLTARAACAWNRVNTVGRSGAKKLQEEYKALARRFPALMHNAGLCQAVAFAVAKGGTEGNESAPSRYLDDLAAVMGFESGAELNARCLEAGLGEYLLLTRRAMDAAGWLSRYVEAVFPEEHKGEAP